MFRKLSFSIAAALTLFAGIARAAPDAEFSLAESGIPDSVEFARRMPGTHSPSNEEVEALEALIPDSVQNANWKNIDVVHPGQPDWGAAEFASPEVR